MSRPLLRRRHRFDPARQCLVRKSPCARRCGNSRQTHSRRREGHAPRASRRGTRLMAAKVKLVKEEVTEETETKHAGHVAAASTKPAPKKPKVTVPGAITLAIDIGGTGLKAAVLDAKGNMLTDRVRVDTPAECTPALLVSSLHTLVHPLPHFDRVSVGFPGVVRNG